MDELAIKATASLGSENDSPLGQVLFSRKKKKIERREVGKGQRQEITTGERERQKDREVPRGSFTSSCTAKHLFDENMLCLPL